MTLLLQLRQLVVVEVVAATMLPLTMLLLVTLLFLVLVVMLLMWLLAKMLMLMVGVGLRLWARGERRGVGNTRGPDGWRLSASMVVPPAETVMWAMRRNLR